LAAAFLASVTSTAMAGAYKYEDIIYWTPNGSFVNPNPAPLDAIVKIQQTVYDCPEAYLIVNDLTAAGALTPPVYVNGGITDERFQIYVYSITNLHYDAYAPGQGLGNGLSGFNNVSGWVAGGGRANVYAPTMANTAWTPQPGFAGPVEWDNPNGLGILKGQTRSEFILAVPCGDPSNPFGKPVHGFYDGNWVHTWVGGVQKNLVYGVLSGPLIPEPGTIGMLLLGIVIAARRRR